MKYLVIFSQRGRERVLGRFNTPHEAASFADRQRKWLRELDTDETEMGVYIQTDEERRRMEQVSRVWERLSYEERHTYIEVDGRKYVKAIYAPEHPDK